MNVTAAAAAFTAIPTLVEVWKRRVDVRPELPRKLVHTGSGLLAAALPYFLSYREIIGLTAGFVLVMAVSRGAHVFTAVHSAERDSYGELFFPLGVGVLATMHPQHWVFAYAVLVLALADTAAAAVGMRFPFGRYPFGGKSLTGTLAFTLVAFAVGIPFAPVAACALAAVAAACVEAVAPRGLDNLAVPVVAALLIGVT